MSDGSFILVRFKDREKLYDAVSQLEDNKKVDSWNAVDGYFGLVLTTKDSSTPDWVKQLDGFSELASCEVIRSGSGKEQPTDSAYSYLFVETDEEHRSELFETINAMDETYLCAETKGDFGVVAVVGGEDFSAIDQHVQDKVHSLTGLLRMKTDRIIYLDRI
ncbi:MAG: hypothetical protein P1R58_12700 [bacterium]|nr:hypothetical protein [bacterium]